MATVLSSSCQDRALTADAVSHELTAARASCGIVCQSAPDEDFSISALVSKAQARHCPVYTVVKLDPSFGKPVFLDAISFRKNRAYVESLYSRSSTTFSVHYYAVRCFEKLADSHEYTPINYAARRFEIIPLSDAFIETMHGVEFAGSSPAQIFFDALNPHMDDISHREKTMRVLALASRENPVFFLGNVPDFPFSEEDVQSIEACTSALKAYREEV